MKKEIILREGPSTCWVIRGAFDEVPLVHWTESIPWQQNSIRMYGKTHPEPRLTAWMGPAYRYSSIQWPAAPFTAEMREFVKEVEVHTETGGYFNACLFNQYRDGQDSMGWHRDNEPEIDASVHRQRELWSLSGLRNPTPHHEAKMACALAPR